MSISTFFSFEIQQQHKGPPFQMSRRSNNLSIDTNPPRKRPSLKRSLSFEVPSPSASGSGTGSWNKHYNSNNNSSSSSNNTTKNHDYYPTTVVRNKQSTQAPRGGGSKYSVTKRDSITSNSSTTTTSSTRSKRQMRKSKTWHPNLNNSSNLTQAELYDEARKLKKAKESFERPILPGIDEKMKTKKATFTHQQNLSWSQAENLIASYQVINVNPLYYSATEGPPKQPCSRYFIRGCENIDIDLDGPSYVTDALYLGDRHDASDRRKMANLGITHVVNATRDIANFFQGQVVGGRRIKYMNVPINDADGVDIMKYFGETNKFLLGCVRNGGRALIHCRAGVCRSTTILCAFLMYFETWRLVPTLNYLKEQRFIIHPNDDFRQQLVLYELVMFGKSSAKPYLRSDDWGTYKLRALLNRSGIESWLPDRGSLCTIQ